MSKCGNCCYGVMTGPNRMFCSAQNCFCEEVLYCEDYEPIVKPITNADRIRRMTDEELAGFLAEYRCVHKAPHCREANCEQCWLDWMRQEAKG